MLWIINSQCNPIQESHDKWGQLDSYASRNDQMLKQLRQSESICIRGWRGKGHVVHNQNREGLLHEFPLWMNRVTHVCVCKKTNLVNTGSLGKCSDSTIQFYPDFPATGRVLEYPFHLLAVWHLQDVGLHKQVTSSSQSGVAPRDKFTFGKILPCLSYNKYVSSGKI